MFQLPRKHRPPVLSLGIVHSHEQQRRRRDHLPNPRYKVFTCVHARTSTRAHPRLLFHKARTPAEVAGWEVIVPPSSSSCDSRPYVRSRELATGPSSSAAAFPRQEDSRVASSLDCPLPESKKGKNTRRTVSVLGRVGRKEEEGGEMSYSLRELLPV